MDDDIDSALRALRDDAAGSLFPTEGMLEVEGLTEAVTITRGPFGMPTIDAATTDDLWFAQGMLTAGERLFQLDLALRAANGRLSEMFGPLTIEADRFARTVGLHLAGARMVSQDWSEDDHAMHERFRRGVRAWLTQALAPPLEYRILGTAPKMPKDPAAWASCFSYLAWGLSNNLETELLRATIERHAGEDAMRLLVPPVSGHTALGSNAWAISGQRTTSGRPILANDPHLLALQPGPWLPIHLRAPGYDVKGVALTFGPGVVLGATPHHAWGATNVTGDVQDLFEVGPDDITGTRVERITVLGDPDPQVIDVPETRHGPILHRVPVGATSSVYDDIDPPYALRWTGHEHGLRPSTIVRLAQASSFEEFRTAALEVGCPGQNFVYADIDGHIGVQVTGVHPIRRHGDGTVPLADHGWEGRIPADEMPWILDPPDGLIVSANDGVLTHGLSEHLITADFHQPNRAERIRELIDGSPMHDAAGTARIQRDTVSLAARRAVPLLLERVPDAATHLAGWDLDLAPGSRPAAVFQRWTEAIAHHVLGPHLPEPAVRAYLASPETWRCAVLPDMLASSHPWITTEHLTAALDEVLVGLGSDGTWGDVHRLRLAHPLAVIPGLAPLFTAVDAPMGGDEQTIAAAGADLAAGEGAAVIASVRMVWDLADPQAGTPVVPTGVSGNPASPHWNDQFAGYTDGPVSVSAPAETQALTLEPSG